MQCPKSIAGAVAVKDEFEKYALGVLAASFPDNNTEIQERFSVYFEAVSEQAFREVYTPASCMGDCLYGNIEEDLKLLLDELKDALVLMLREERGSKDYFERWKLLESDHFMEFVRAGIAEVPLRNLIGKPKPLKKRLDFAKAIRKACTNAGLNALDFSDRCSSRMTVKSFFQVKFAMIDYLARNPNDVVFFTQDAAEWIGFYVKHTGIKDTTIGAVAFRGEDYAHLAHTLRDDAAVKQGLAGLTAASLECCICLADLTGEDGGVILNTSSSWVCGHWIYMSCEKGLDQCPTCRETLRFDQISNSKTKSNKKPQRSRRSRR